jgi:hypothetical protein
MPDDDFLLEVLGSGGTQISCSYGNGLQLVVFNRPSDRQASPLFGRRRSVWPFVARRHVTVDEPLGVFPQIVIGAETSPRRCGSWRGLFLSRFRKK